MKLKKFLKTIDPVGMGKTTIWGMDEKEPLWKGDSIFDIPWWITDLKINDDAGIDAPVSFYHYVNEYGADMIETTISVIE